MIKCITGCTLLFSGVFLWVGKLISVAIYASTKRHRSFSNEYDLDMSIFGLLPEVGALIMLIFGICLLTQSVNEYKASLIGYEVQE